MLCTREGCALTDTKNNKKTVYSQLSLSPNLALLCATRAYQEPVIVATTAVEFGEAIAISVLAERDISDVTGLIASPGQGTRANCLCS